MGLASYKEWKKKNDIICFLKEFGITEEDLKYLPTALKIVRENELKPNIINISPKEKQDIDNKSRTAITAKDIIDQFAGDTEEFYPYGKPKENK